MQVDFKEERKWKTAVAFRLAYSALEWFHASPQRRKELSVKWQIPRSDDELDADRVKEEVMDIDIDSERDAEPSASHKESDIENFSYRRPRTTITVQPRTRVVDDDEDGDEDEEDEDEDDETAAKAVEAQAALDAGTAVKEAAEDLEKHTREKEKEQDEVVQIMDVVKTTGPEGKADEDAEGEADADAEMDAEGEVEAEGDPDAGVQDTDNVLEPLGIPDVAEAPAVAPPDIKECAPVESSEPPPSRGRSALRPGAENAPLSSTALSVLDTKTLRTPLLNLDLEETILDLSGMVEDSLSIDERGSYTPDRDSISLPNLFPELDLYSFADPPTSGTNDKKSRRVDESGMSVGRLTLATRIMDSKNVLVSSLQPGKQYRQGVWDILSENPVSDEPRDGQDSKSDATPPTARKSIKM